MDLVKRGNEEISFILLKNGQTKNLRMNNRRNMKRTVIDETAMDDLQNELEHLPESITKVTITKNDDGSYSVNTENNCKELFEYLADEITYLQNHIINLRVELMKVKQQLKCKN